MNGDGGSGVGGDDRDNDVLIIRLGCRGVYCGSIILSFAVRQRTA